MFTVIGLMLGGMAIGFLLRRQEFSWINKVITSLIWVLLFLLGVEVGGNRPVSYTHLTLPTNSRV